MWEAQACAGRAVCQDLHTQPSLLMCRIGGWSGGPCPLVEMPRVLGQVVGAALETEADVPSAASFGWVLLHRAASALPAMTGVLGVMRT